MIAITRDAPGGIAVVSADSRSGLHGFLTRIDSRVRFAHWIEKMGRAGRGDDMRELAILSLAAMIAMLVGWWRYKAVRRRRRRVAYHARRAEEDRIWNERIGRG